MSKTKKLGILVGVLLIILILLLFMTQIKTPVQNPPVGKTYIVFEEEESQMNVGGGGYNHTTLLSTGDGNYVRALSVGCDITSFLLPLDEVQTIQEIILANKLYDKECLIPGGTDYYVRYTLGDGLQTWYINSGPEKAGIYESWISKECKVYFNQINEIILQEVNNPENKKYYSKDCTGN